MTLHFSPEETDIGARPSHENIASPKMETAIRASEGSRGETYYRRIAKYLLDISLTLVAAPIVLPLVLLMAALIMLDGHNPFYSQLRVGRQGRIFRMWKLRTMVHDAEARLEGYLSKNPAAKLEWDTTQKLKSDPRITLIGRILRKTSLDELPQLLNVLKGDMSLVGPRPMMACQRKNYSGLSYYNLRPGITGLWQVSDRNHCEFSARAYYDDLYDKTMSLRTDISVLLRTVGVVLRGTGY
jgi:exopolysaccharide production protein ExoY